MRLELTLTIDPNRAPGVRLDRALTDELEGSLSSYLACDSEGLLSKSGSRAFRPSGISFYSTFPRILFSNTLELG